MEVILAHTFDPSHLSEGGALKYAWNILEHLLKKNIDTSLFGVQLGKQKFKHPKFTFKPIIKGPSKWYQYFFNLFLKLPFLKLSDKAIIHTCRLDFMFPFVLFCRKNPKIITSDEPLGWAILKFPKPLSNIITWAYHKVELYCLNRIDILIADKNTIKNYFLKRYPHLKYKFKVMYTSGVDLNKFRPINKIKIRRKYGLKKRDKIILFVGRLAKVKDIDFLFKIFPVIKKTIPKAKLVLVGGGEDKLRLKQLSKDLNLKGILFFGEKHPDQMPEIYNLADLLVLCSVTEGSPTVVREALACGVPVVTNNVGDVTDAIKNTLVGRIVEKTKHKYSKTVVGVLKMASSKPEKVRKACREMSKNFTFEKVAQNIMKLYQEVENG